MGHVTVVFVICLAGLLLVCGFPVRTTPFTYSHGSNEADGVGAWDTRWVYVAGPALALVCTAMGLLFGCTWCYRHKDCKLFTASATHLHDGSSRRSQPPDSGFSEPTNNNISEDNNNGPISLREMQNIANNNATAYIVSENEERNRAVSRESVVEFEPLPADIGAAADPLAHCADWFERVNEEIPRDRLQYLREIGRGWFGRIVEGEIEPDQDNNTEATVAVKILNQNLTPADKARFLEEAKMFRDLRHEGILPLLAHCLREEPWILVFELCPMNLQEYLISNRPKMAILNESGVPLQLQCDIASALAYIHARNYVYGHLWSGNVLVRGTGATARAVIGRYTDSPPPSDAWTAPELTRRHVLTSSSEVWSLGVLLWETCSWGAAPAAAPLSEPALPCPYRTHLFQVMQLCWNSNPDARPSASQVHVLLNHLHTSHQQTNDVSQDDGYGSSNFEERWQRLKPNTIPKIDEHVAIVHAPSMSASHFNGSDQDFEDNANTIQDTLSVDLETAVSRSSSIMSDKDPLSIQIKSESLTNLHGSLEDVRNIYLNHSEHTIVECQQENIPDREMDNSDSSELNRLDPWVKDILAGSQDDVSYYRDVSDVIKNLDYILNSEKTSSSESSHQASPSRDNLTLDCKKEYTMQSSLVKSPGINNFQNILDITPEHKPYTQERCVEDEMDRESIGALNHSYERHSDTTSQNTLENLTPDTPHVDIEDPFSTEQFNVESSCTKEDSKQDLITPQTVVLLGNEVNQEQNPTDDKYRVPHLTDLCLATVNSNNSVSNLEKEVERVKCEFEHSCVPFDVEKETELLEDENNKLNDIIKVSGNEVSVDVNQGDIVAHSKEIQDLDLDVENVENKIDIVKDRAKDSNDDVVTDLSRNSTVYMDLINDTDSEILNKRNSVDDNIKNVIDTISYSNLPYNENETGGTLVFSNNESTMYLDLPTVINETAKLIDSERACTAHDTTAVNNPTTFNVITASTPRGSVVEDSLDSMKIDDTKETTSLVEAPDYGPGVTVTRLEPRFVPDMLSPFDSPTKSQPTDTFDENSSVLLGPFENCTLDFFKGVKTSVAHTSEYVDVPKEELLAFSSNFTEINLETPSPLRDGNFLNEVPDIEVNEDGNLDVRDTTNGLKFTIIVDHKESPFQEIGESSNQDLSLPPLSPTTPPNSPGNFLSSSPQHKYLIENVINDPLQDNLPDPVEEPTSLDNEVSLNQIDLQLTSKLAMAENENNMNIEYLGPSTLEESGSGSSRDPEEVFLGGNGGGSLMEELVVSQEGGALFEESMRALRNELELKLPLAQSINIEPPVESDTWSGELPLPPELVVNYPGALSPILEETGHQLSAYENDRPWTVSTRTESSESYPEPCNNSTDDVTELPTAAARDDPTYTVHSDNSQPTIDTNTYTIQKDLTSREVTMSADSLNPNTNENKSIDDKTWVAGNEGKDENVERLSQISPFILSPTTETSVPENTYNATAMSTLSKTTVPTDAKSSKPSETQCLSKATSIDSWCSNDTLFNVEDNFDDLAMDPDFEAEGEDDHSSRTLTHHDEEKDTSHCSTYIVHGSKSEICNTFTPDSITANNAEKKDKTEAIDKNTPSFLTKSDINDSSTKNTQTKDLAYGTLVSSCNSHVASYSNCTTEAFSSAPDDPWKLYQPPEMIRRSPVTDELIMSPPQTAILDDNDDNQQLPKLNTESSIKKMDSIEISCLKDKSLELVESQENSVDRLHEAVEQSPCNNVDSIITNTQFKYAAPSASSTPMVDLKEDDDSAEVIPLDFPQNITYNDGSVDNSSGLNFQAFSQSADRRPQDISFLDNKPNTLTDTDTALLLEGVSDIKNTMTYSDFQDSAVHKPQEIHTPILSSQTFDSALSNSSEGFRQFENSVRSRPQDLTAIESTTLLLSHEIQSSELIDASSNPNINVKITSLITMDKSNDEALESSAKEDNSKKQETANSSMNNDEIIDLNLDESLFENTNAANVVSFENICDLSHSNNEDSEKSNKDAIAVNECESKNDPVENNISNTFASHDSEHNTDYDSHGNSNFNQTFDSHCSKAKDAATTNDSPSEIPVVNGILEVITNEKVLSVENAVNDNEYSLVHNKTGTSSQDNVEQKDILVLNNSLPNGTVPHALLKPNNVKSEKYATVNYIAEPYEELQESNVDDGLLEDKNDVVNMNNESELIINNSDMRNEELISNVAPSSQNKVNDATENHESNIETDDGVQDMKEEDNNMKLLTVTEDFLLNEKHFCQLDSYLPLLSDIRFTGPADDCMTTSFNQESPTEDKTDTLDSEDKKIKENGNTAADILKEWDSDSDDSHSNSSSGEFIWKEGRSSGAHQTDDCHHDEGGGGQSAGEDGARSSGSGDSGSGSEGDELEFVPSSWDCRAAPAKSSLRSLEAQPDNKKRVVFKRQKYHCVYEYPRELPDPLASPYLPDYSTYSEWDSGSAEEAELGYGQLYGAHPMDLYPLQAGVAFTNDYDEDFFISSSARPFESLGIMSTTSQFFPGMHALKAVPAPLPDYPPPPSPLHTPATHTPSLDFTTPDSGVEDITPGSTTTDEDFKKLPVTELAHCWKSVDSNSSSESVSPSSPASESLGGLRHTRDKLKLDLPPSPCVPSPRQNRVFNFTLDKPKSRPRSVPADETLDTAATPLVMTDETPNVTTSLPLQHCDELPLLEPTFSTFGKSIPKTVDAEKAIIFDDVQESRAIVDANVDSESIDGGDKLKSGGSVKGEGGTVLDSGDEDSGIESSSKATLERNKPAPNVSQPNQT